MEKWKFKLFLQIILRWNGMCGIAFFCFVLIFLKNGPQEDFNIILNIGILMMIIFAVMPLATIIAVYLITNFLKNRIKYDGYYTEIEKMYPPAMLSYLLDDFIEKNEDLLATILNLSIKKIINIEQNNNGLLISVNENNNEIKNLYYHEKYIINALKGKQKIDFKKFYEMVIFDCESNRLICIKKNPKINFLMEIRLMLALIGLFGLFVGMSVTRGPFLLFISSILVIVAYIGKFFIKTHDKTAKGLEFAIKAKMLKNYIRDYTLLAEKNYDYITISDKYIPYALALGEATKIEELHIEGNKLIKDIVKDIGVISEIVNIY